MNILSYSNFVLNVTPEALLIKPIRDMYNADKTKSKDRFMQQMSLLYFAYDPRSNYSYLVNEEERWKEVLKQEGLPEDYKPSKDLMKAIDIYKKLNETAATMLLHDTKVAISKVRGVLTSIDFDVLEEKDKIAALDKFTAVASKINRLVKELSEAEKAVNSEFAEQGKARGNSELTILDAGIKI